MIYERSTLAVAIFAIFVGITLGLSFYLGRRAKSASGYFAASGEIHWFVNGIAFAGDYLSAASFLGICGMIAFYGYDAVGTFGSNATRLTLPTASAFNLPERTC